MPQINFGLKEVSCKVVYYGPGMSGKTTNLEVIHAKAPPQAVGQMSSINTESDRTLYFDFLPLDLGQIGGMRTKLQLYTVPGQIYYNATRKLVLQGADGVVFVADSSPTKLAENLESLQNLLDNLAEIGCTVDPKVTGKTLLPFVVQYNKRDLPDAMSVDQLDDALGVKARGWSHVEACAKDGRGVFDTLKQVAKLVIAYVEDTVAGKRQSGQMQRPPSGVMPTPASRPPSGIMPAPAVRSSGTMPVQHPASATRSSGAMPAPAVRSSGTIPVQHPAPAPATRSSGSMPAPAPAPARQSQPLAKPTATMSAIPASQRPTRIMTPVPIPPPTPIAPPSTPASVPAPEAVAVEPTTKRRSSTVAIIVVVVIAVLMVTMWLASGHAAR